MTVHVAFSFAVLTSIVFPLGALFFIICSLFCLVFNLLPHCNNKPFISNN